MIRILAACLLLLIFLHDLKDIRKYKKIQYKDLVVHHKQVLIQYSVLLIGFIGVALAFQLKFSYLMLLVLGSVFALIYILRKLVQFYDNFEETSELILVMTHLSHQFKQHQKIEHALQSVYEVCNDKTRLHLDAVADALHTTGYQEAFSLYNEHYILKTLITTMVHAQEQGDDHIMHALHLIEEDIDDLNNQIFSFVRDMVALRNKILMLLAFGMGVSLVSQNMLNLVVDLKDLSLYQDVVFIFLFSVLFLLAVSFKIMSIPLIMKEENLR